MDEGLRRKDAMTLMVPEEVALVTWSGEDIKQFCSIARRKFDERTCLKFVHAVRLHDLLVAFVEQIKGAPRHLPYMWAEAAVSEISKMQAPGYRGACHIFLCDIDVALREFYARKGVGLGELLDNYPKR